MELFDKERMLLQTAVNNAFKDVKCPGDDNVLSPDCMDTTDIEDFIRDSIWKTDWRQIPAEVIDYNYESLSFFSPDAYRFYLPAYLVRSLDTFITADINVLDFTVYDLVPNKTLLKRFNLRKQALSNQQKLVIVELLEFVKKWSDKHLSSFADEGIQGYW